MNKHEKYEIKTIVRNEIHNAEYNPRKITEKARKRLKTYIVKVGLLQPPVVNKNSMNIVAGHQRISIMDSFFRKDDYELTVCMVDLTEKEEIEANIKLNNANLMGEWDKEKLFEIKEFMPDIDFKIDLDFDQFDVDYLFSDNEEKIEKLTPKQAEVQLDIDQIAKLKETKKENRKKLNKQDANGESEQIEKDDYMRVFVFNNNAEARSFDKLIKQPHEGRYYKSSALYEILKDEYKRF
jgi:hypothetical protein